MAKRGAVTITGFPELGRQFDALQTQSRVQVLVKGVEEAAEKTRDEMSKAAPRNPLGPTRPGAGHGADSIVVAKPDRGGRKDTRALNVGPRAFWMVYQEFGTPFHTAQPFVQPTGDRMRAPVVRTIAKRMNKAIRVAT